MRLPLRSAISISALLAAGILDATCGGGGGGGMGGATPSGPAQQEVYYVPWKVLGSAGAIPTEGLILYWFPTSVAEARASSLTASRRLTLAAGQCVAPILVPADEQLLHARFGITPPAVILASLDGSQLGRVEAKSGGLEVSAVEKELSAFLDRTEKALDKSLDDAKAKVKAGDQPAAIVLYQQVAAQRCLFPSLGKKAAKALDKLGHPVARDPVADLESDSRRLPDLSDTMTAAQLATMKAGLAAERALDIPKAQALYEEAHRRDPGDPVPTRFLAELHRHHTGDWQQARILFESLAAGSGVDPLSRAVALHGLGKMTIHAGGFADGVGLFNTSLANFPLALTYRNLAVYWSSEGQTDRAYAYVEQALALDPDDAYTQIFAATFYVVLGRPAQAEAIARQHEGMLEASYNLAAIWAQLGNREKMLELLARHFETYEKYDPVRAKEMQEARDDRVFAAFHRDSAFIQLTKLADGDPSSYHRSLAPAIPGASR
jgi:tetratricopeptide (TPR) repeat protein